MKKIVVPLIIFMLIFIGCSKIEDTTKTLVEDIDSIGKVSLKNEKQIDDILKRYNSLSNEQKKYVNNVDVLFNAEIKVKELEIEDLESAVKDSEKANKELEKEIKSNEESSKTIENEERTEEIKRLVRNAFIYIVRVDFFEDLVFPSNFKEAYIMYYPADDELICFFGLNINSKVEYFMCTRDTVGSISLDEMNDYEDYIGYIKTIVNGKDDGFYKIENGMYCTTKDVLDKNAYIYYDATEDMRAFIYGY